MGKVTFHKALKFGDKLPDFRGAEHREGAWHSITLDRFKRLTVEELLKSDLRLVFEWSFNEDDTRKKLRVCTLRQDVDTLKRKYPNDPVINLEAVKKLLEVDIQNTGVVLGNIYWAAYLGATVEG